MKNCALKLVNEIILYYDARSKKYQKTAYYYVQTSSFTSTAPFASQMNPIHVLTPHISKILEKMHAFCMVYTMQCSKPYSLPTFVSPLSTVGPDYLIVFHLLSHKSNYWVQVM